MPQFTFGTSTIDYTLTHVPDKNNVRITVDWTDGVRVFAPPHLSSDKLEQILHKKAPWILQKVCELAEIHACPQRKEFLSGEKFPYLGRNYRLKVKRSDVHSPTLTFRLGCFLAEIPTDFSEEDRKLHVRRLLREWYITHGEKKLKERLRIYSPRMELYPSKLTVTEHRMRWGSCTKKEPSPSTGEC
jgi:predicted metal-dependent hydrolase